MYINIPFIVNLISPERCETSLRRDPILVLLRSTSCFNCSSLTWWDERCDFRWCCRWVYRRSEKLSFSKWVGWGWKIVPGTTPTFQPPREEYHPLVKYLSIRPFLLFENFQIVSRVFQKIPRWKLLKSTIQPSNIQIDTNTSCAILLAIVACKHFHS